MTVPSIHLNEAVIDGDHDALAANGLPPSTLPPGLVTSGKLLDEPIVAPRDNGVSKPSHLKFYRIS
jgi:hypothetical protein